MSNQPRAIDAAARPRRGGTFFGADREGEKVYSFVVTKHRQVAREP